MPEREHPPGFMLIDLREVYETCLSRLDEELCGIDWVGIDVVTNRIQKSVVFAIGRDTWKDNGGKRLKLKRWQEPLAGIFLAILGSAQNLDQEKNSQNSNDLVELYSQMVEEVLRPGCIGSMLRKPKRSLIEIENLEKAIMISCNQLP
jgi:hypothetical protein